jgi:5-methylthioribose kinase
MPDGSLPAVVFEDAANYIFALEAAPKSACDWKTLLLGGDARVEHARAAAETLRALASAHGRDANLAPQFHDQTSFDQLRLDPYYRFTASRHPDLAGAFEDAIARCRRPLALVHGDFSPKNFLVTDQRMLLIDFEVIHLGDPAFDAAFMLNHLLLKTWHGIGACRELAREFWRGLGGAISEPDTILHLGCLHLARVDGKSPAEYLTAEEQTQVRGFARELIRNPPRTVEEIFT